MKDINDCLYSPGMHAYYISLHRDVPILHESARRKIWLARGKFSLAGSARATIDKNKSRSPHRGSRATPWEGRQSIKYCFMQACAQDLGGKVAIVAIIDCIDPRADACSIKPFLYTHRTILHLCNKIESQSLF
jgi:hypothetical protein